jgi:hypothetical protein
MRKRLYNEFGICLALVVAIAVISCKKTETNPPPPTPVPTVVSSAAVCTFHNLPAGTPPVCHDASGANVPCPDNYASLPECPSQ